MRQKLWWHVRRLYWRLFPTPEAAYIWWRKQQRRNREGE